MNKFNEPHSYLWRKIFLTMKFIFIFLLLSICNSFADSYAQNEKLSVKAQNATLSEIITIIEKQSDYSFFYQSEDIDNTHRYNIELKNRSINEILDRITSNTLLVYKISGKYIFLNKKEATPKLSQQKKETLVKGLVLDEKGNPIPGVTITIVGSTKGVITDIDGIYSIDVPSFAQLQFSFVGYETQTIEVNNQATVNIILKEKVSELEEVTVVAFGKQKKESVVGSITTINPDELKIPSSNLTTALAGRMAGIIAYQRSGEPGRDNAEFFIRGVTTFGYKKDPLILIDNNESSTEDLARMQPDDIASFSILKDATASALYGSRGANGVILVTTKEGREGKARINVRYEESISMPTQMVELADPITYMKLHNEAVRTRNPQAATPYSQNKIEHTMRGDNPYVYPANDWYNILFKDYANNHRLNFNVSGGGKIARYYLAGSIIHDSGVLKVDKKNNFNNNINLKRYMLRSNVNINITPTTEAVVRFHGSFDDYTGPIDGGTELFKRVMRTNPVLFPPYYSPDSTHIYAQHILFGNYDKGQYNNPYADMTRGYKDYTISQMNVQFELKQQLDFITKALSLRALFNTSRYSYFDVSRFYNPFYYKVASYDKIKDEYILALINEKSGTEYLDYNEGTKNITSTTYFETALDWHRIFFEEHELGGLLVFTMREQFQANAGDLQKSLPYRNISLAGRATHAYKSRYFTEFNFGYNGSERFSKKERFGFFPSIGLGWLVSNENFWSENIKKNFNKLKLKTTYGLVGNDAIGDVNDRFFYLSNVNMNNDSRSSSFGTYGNRGGYTLKGVSISRYPNDLITWEIAKKIDLGLEVGLWNDLDIQIDAFHEYRSNILMNRSIPTTMGLQATVRANVGEASSKGIDASLSYNHSFNKNCWLSGLANFTYATSKFEVYEEPDYSETPWKSHIGYPLNQSWGYVAERLFVDEQEIRNSPTQFGDYKAGDIKYKDINKDGQITELDKVPIGYPTNPEIVYGFGLSCGWKSFDLSFFFQGLARESFFIDVQDVDNRISTAPFIGGQGALLKAYADSHWSESNRDLYAVWPRLSETYIVNNQQQSTWFMRDGSFLRLKSVEFGYALPQANTQKAGISNLRLYFSGTNLLTFRKFKLWDPEMGGDGLGYPVQKVFNLGIQFSF
jgi:TonB-linked SusC/RagA family outer membrane protein